MKEELELKVKVYDFMGKFNDKNKNLQVSVNLFDCKIIFQ
ncbi:MAG: hypothetical protein ABIL18_05950 [candidate division WOR-3 bacterium]